MGPDARRRRPRPRLGLWATLVVVALLSAACTAATGGADGARPPEGVLRVGLERPQSLDPAQARFPADFLVIDQLFDGLTSYDPQTLSVQPAVAAAWESNPEQTVWTFTIRPDARFATGRQITSADVKYSLERIARQGSGSPAAAQLEVVAGYTAFHVDGSADSLAGVVAAEPHVVRIELQFPFAGFPAVLGHPAFGIVPREAVEAASPPFAEQPVGSGPFMIRSRSADVLRLIPAPGVRPAIDGIDIHMGRDSMAPYTAFLRGRLDWTAVPAERVAEVARSRGRDSFRPYPAQLLYGFNLKNPKFADVRFRLAVVRALNRRTIVETAFAGRVRPSLSLVAEGVPGHQPDPCGEPCRYDPAGARALVAEVFGERPVPEIRIDYDDDPVQAAVASAIQANLQAAGIPATLRAHDYTAYLGFAASGQQELFRLAWIGAYPSPDAFLTPLFYTGQADNVTGFSSHEVDGLLGAARAEPDEATRVALYQQAEKLILAAAPVIPLAQYETHTLVSPRVQGLIMTAFGSFDASRVRLAG